MAIGAVLTIPFYFLICYAIGARQCKANYFVYLYYKKFSTHENPYSEHQIELSELGDIAIFLSLFMTFSFLPIACRVQVDEFKRMESEEQRFQKIPERLENEKKKTIYLNQSIETLNKRIKQLEQEQSQKMVKINDIEYGTK